jgi:hypothetical protein
MLIKQGEFPKPYKLTAKGRSVGWREGDIDDWIAGKIAPESFPVVEEKKPPPDTANENAGEQSIVIEDKPSEGRIADEEDQQEANLSFDFGAPQGDPEKEREEAFKGIVIALLAIDGLKTPSQKEIEQLTRDIKDTFSVIRRKRAIRDGGAG